MLKAEQIKKNYNKLKSILDQREVNWYKEQKNVQKYHLEKLLEKEERETTM